MHGSRVVEWIRTTPHPVNFKFIISQSKMIENRPTLPPQELSFGTPPPPPPAKYSGSAHESLTMGNKL